MFTPKPATALKSQTPTTQLPFRKSPVGVVGVTIVPRFAWNRRVAFVPVAFSISSELPGLQSNRSALMTPPAAAPLVSNRIVSADDALAQVMAISTPAAKIATFFIPVLLR